MDPAFQEETLRCTDRNRAMLQTMIDEGLAVSAILWALSQQFSSLLAEGEGPPAVFLQRLLGCYTALSAPARRDARLCSQRLSLHIDGLKSDGLSSEAVLWSLIGAMGGILRQTGYTQTQIEAFTSGAIQAIHSNRTTTH